MASLEIMGSVLKRKILRFLPFFLRPKGDVPETTLELGKISEDAACKFLKKKGYKIIARNYSCRVGEIDIVALDGGVIAFVEVRSRKGGSFGEPGASITRDKSRRIIKAAWNFLKFKGIRDRDCRFDVVSITYKEGRKEPQINLFKNAFSALGYRGR